MAFFASDFIFVKLEHKSVTLLCKFIACNLSIVSSRYILLPTPAAGFSSTFVIHYDGFFPDCPQHSMAAELGKIKFNSVGIQAIFLRQLYKSSPLLGNPRRYQSEAIPSCYFPSPVWCRNGKTKHLSMWRSTKVDFATRIRRSVFWFLTICSWKFGITLSIW